MPVAIPLISAAATVGGALINKKASDNASEAAAKAGQVTPVDINALNQTVQQQSTSNAALSNQLEQQYNPYINALRQSSAASLGQYLNPSQSQQNLSNGVMNAFTQASQSPLGSTGSLSASPLFTNAANAAQQQLNLGGSLDQETQNQVMRAGAAHAGQLAGPGGGLGLGRDISARDLGLTSLQLQQQRQQNAANIGSTQQNYGLNAWQAQNQYNLAAQQQQIASMLGLGGLANQMNQNQFNNAYNITGLTQGIQAPEVGLSPSSIAGITVGNSNMANSANQNSAGIQAQQANSQANLGGQLFGYRLNALGNSNIFKTSSPTGKDAYGNPIG